MYFFYLPSINKYHSNVHLNRKSIFTLYFCYIRTPLPECISSLLLCPCLSTFRLFLPPLSQTYSLTFSPHTIFFLSCVSHIFYFLLSHNFSVSVRLSLSLLSIRVCWLMQQMLLLLMMQPIIFLQLLLLKIAVICLYIVYIYILDIHD